MFDLTDYVGTWYKALAMFLLMIFGGAAANYIIFGGEYSSYLVGSSFTALIVAIIAYRQKQRKQSNEEVSRFYKAHSQSDDKAINNNKD
ncbi:hypothetical protein ACTTZI_004205 [Vibrio vulnificus]